MFNYNMYNPYIPANQRTQNVEQQYTPYTPYTPQPQQSYPQNPQSYPQASVGLQGKTVESLEVAKVMEIPLDGSTSFFPLADGSAIITKQLQADGTSKTVIYKPDLEPQKTVEQPKYVTEEEVKEMIESGSDGLLDDIQELRRELRNISEDMKELRKPKDAKRKGEE